MDKKPKAYIFAIVVDCIFIAFFIAFAYFFKNYISTCLVVIGAICSIMINIREYNGKVISQRVKTFEKVFGWLWQLTAFIEIAVNIVHMAR